MHAAVLPGAGRLATDYGLAGIVLAVLLFVAWRVYGDLRRDCAERVAEANSQRDRSEAARAALEQDMRERVIPALIEVTRVTQDAALVVRDQARRSA